MTKIKQGYKYNFNVVGSPTITDQGVASGFSTSNHLQMSSYPTNVLSFEILIKFQTGSFTGTWQAITGQTTTNITNPQLGISTSNNLSFGLPVEAGNWGTSISYPIAENTTYWVKMTWDGTQKEMLISTDGETYTSAGVESQSTAYWVEPLQFGSDLGVTPFLGSIDLTETYININGQRWWDALTATTFYGDTYQVRKGLSYQVRIRADGKWDYTGNQTFTTAGQEYFATMTAYNGLDMSYEESYQSADKVNFSNTVLPWKWQYLTTLSTNRYCLMPTGQNYENVAQVGYTYNFNVIGSPTFDYDNQQMSNMTANDCIYTTSNFNPGSSSWEIKTRVYVGDNFEGTFLNAPVDPRSVRCGYYPGGLWQLLISNGSSWINTTNFTGSYTTNVNTWYYVKITFDGSNTYKLEISEDDLNYTTVVSYTSSSKIGSYPIYTYYWNGKIDLSETYVKINGADWWVPEITKGAGTSETLPGCTYNFTDDGSATTLNCFAVNGDESIVLTPDNSYNIPAQQGGFFGGAIFFSHNPGVTLEMLNVYDSNGNLKWQWDGNYNVVGDLSVNENEEGIVTTFGYENGSYIETQDAFTFEQGDFWEAGAYFLCLTTGSQQTVMSSKGFELGVDQNGHPYGTFYGIGTITLTDMTFGLGDEADISCWYSNDGDGYKYHLQSTLHNRVGHAEDVMLNPTMAESGEKVSFGCFQISGAQDGWLLGTVSIPSHTVYEYDNGTWTEANNA